MEEATDIESEDNTQDELCICGHPKYSHDAMGGACGYFLDDFRGDCECGGFKEIF